MKDYTNQTPEFHETIRIYETTDPAHADNTFNIPLKQLFDNTMALRGLMKQKAGGTGIEFGVDDDCLLSAIYTDQEGTEHSVTFPGGGGSGDVDKEIDELQQNVLALTIAVSILQGAQVNGMADNIIVETFADTSGFIIISGTYDSTNHRLYA